MVKVMETFCLSSVSASIDSSGVLDEVACTVELKYGFKGVLSHFQVIINGRF